MNECDKIAKPKFPLEWQKTTTDRIISEEATLKLREFCERCAYDHITPELSKIWRKINELKIETKNLVEK